MQEVVEDSATGYVRRERLVVSLYIACTMLSLSREIYRRWSALVAKWGGLSGSRDAAPAPKLYAPDAYRMALPELQQHVQQALHISSIAAFIAAWDFLSGVGLLWLLYCLTVSDWNVPRTIVPQRVVAVTVALAAMHFPLLWTLDWLRPNTLTCGFLVALSAWLLTRVGRHPAWSVALLSLTLVQAFVRSDYPFFLGVAVLVLALTGLLRDFGSRQHLALIGLAMVVISGGVQVYLQFVAFPHLTYPPGVPVFMLAINTGRPYMAAFTVAMLPAVLIGMGAWIQREHLRSIDWFCLVAPVVYIPLWLTVASAMEVRVFFPMMVLFIPLAGRVTARFLLPNQASRLSHA